MAKVFPWQQVNLVALTAYSEKGNSLLNGRRRILAPDFIILCSIRTACAACIVGEWQPDEVDRGTPSQRHQMDELDDATTRMERRSARVQVERESEVRGASEERLTTQKLIIRL
jgi:hypothetical protein